MEKIRNATSGKNNYQYGTKRTEEYKANLALAQPTRIRLSVFDNQTQTEVIYSSIKAASKALGYSRVAIDYRIKKGGLLKDRYILKIVSISNVDYSTLPTDLIKQDTTGLAPPLNSGVLFNKIAKQPCSSHISHSNIFEVIDEKGLVVYSFTSVEECALMFEVSRRTIQRRLAKNSFFAFKGNKNLMIRRVQLQ